MPRRSDAPPLTSGVVVRGLLFVLAVALGAVGTWLLVTSGSTKSLRLGMLAGLWGLLIGCFALFGSRRAMAAQNVAQPVAAPPVQRPESDRAAELEASRHRAEQAAREHEASARRARAEIEVHRQNSVERVEDAAARRAWEHQLEQLLRTEIRETVNREVSALRAEVASLRGELVEKVGGQLRLERIETTRVIGSDLEALQEEVRKLKSAADSDAGYTLTRGRGPERSTARPVVLPAQVRPVSRATEEVETQVQPAVEPVARTVDEPARATVPAASAVRDAPTAAEMTAPITVTAPEPPAPEPPAAQSPPPPTPAPPAPEPPAPAPPAAQAPEPPAPEPPAPQPPRAAAPPPAAGPSPTATPAPAPGPAPAPASGLARTLDGLDGLPRITPFTDFELDPVEAPGGGSHSAQPQDGPGYSAYHGRRRRPDEEPIDAAGDSGRHADRSTGRRHRSDSGQHASDDDDVLGRLLANRGGR